MTKMMFGMRGWAEDEKGQVEIHWEEDINGNGISDVASGWGALERCCLASGPPVDFFSMAPGRSCKDIPPPPSSYSTSLTHFGPG